MSKVCTASCTGFQREIDLSVAEVALESGFTDHSAFSRAFRASIGVTPSEFRAGVR